MGHQCPTPDLEKRLEFKSPLEAYARALVAHQSPVRNNSLTLPLETWNHPFVKAEKDSQRMKKIYFADLTHTAQGIHAKCMPLGAALVACHIKNEFKDIFDVDLFKIPEELEKAFLQKNPDILCLSNYAWNIRLTASVAKIAKEINPHLIVIAGGPNFPYRQEERLAFLREYDCIDFFVFGEGELALANLLKKIISYDFDMQDLKSSRANIFNCSYLIENELISGEWTRVEKMDQLPCPYTEGMMDKFFDLPLLPLYETTRGCPFSCTFCTDGISEKSKIFRNSPDNIEKSLRYISKRSKHSDALIIADLNFGMYDDDIKTAEIIAKLKVDTGYPLTVGTALGKSQPERILQAVKILGGSLHIGLSFQSTDSDVLKNIKRKNVSTPKLLKAAEDLGLRDAVDYTEIIVGLPGDTRQKHYDTLREGVDLGMTSIRMYQLMLLVGSEMNSVESRKKFGLQTRWRVMPGCAGVYAFLGKELRVAEIEEIVVANNTMSFDDYVECRVMDFVVEVFVNNGWYKEIFDLIDILELKKFDFLEFVRQNDYSYPPKIAEIFDSFVTDTKKDLFMGKNDIEGFVSSENILEKHESGELGNNELLDHKALCYINFKETTKFIFDLFREFLHSKGHLDDTVSSYLVELERFVLCRKNNILDTDIVITEKFNIDFVSVAQASFRINPHHLKRYPNSLRFFHDAKQSSIIKKSSVIYGTSVSGLGRFIQRNKMSRMFRQYERC